MSEKKGAERRRHPRTKKRYTVRFGIGDFTHTGYTQDVSEGGLYLMANTIFPPGTILQVQLEYPNHRETIRGVVRWAKDLPPAFRRNMRGGMGLEFQAVGSPGAAAESIRPSVLRPKGEAPSGELPPEASEQQLERGATRRRQVSTRGGSTFEVLQTEYRGGIYVRIFQLPRTDSSAEARFRQAYRSAEEAEAAVKAFLKAN
jgi:hypothetical protein